jgi:hypothetical protein
MQKDDCSVSEFLIAEAEARSKSKARLDPKMVAQFEQVVREFGRIWTTAKKNTAERRLSYRSSKDGLILHFEVKDQNRWISIFYLRSHHNKGFFTLQGPNPRRDQIKPSKPLLAALDHLNRDWRAQRLSEGLGAKAVTVYLHKAQREAELRYYLSSALTASAAASN